MFGLMRSCLKSSFDWSTPVPRLIWVVLLFLFFPFQSLAQFPGPSDQPALIKVLHRCSRMTNCDSLDLNIYSNGSFVFEASVIDIQKPTPSRRVKHREEGQLSREKLAQFAQLTLEPDFQNAADEYVARRVIDEGSLVTIVARTEKGEKRVTIYNYAIATDAEKAKLPPSILKILQLRVP